MHLVYAIDHLGSGGAQRQAVELAAQLRESTGWRVSFLVYRDVDFYGDRLRAAGIRVVHVPKPWKYDPRLPGRVRAWLRREPADVVHAFLPWPSLWSHLAVRAIAAAERPAFIAGERSTVSQLPGLEQRIERYVYPRSDAVTANARCASEEIHERFGVPRERIHYIPNGIDLSRWDLDGEVEPLLDLEDGSFRLALIGGLRPEKNHAVVIDALVRLGPEATRDWRVWFIGADSAGRAFADGVRRRVQESGLGAVVRFAPPTPRIAAVMRRLDGVLLPSSFEGFPNVALEAMASRVPVVASRVGDVPNMIEDGVTGLLLERIDADATALAMGRLLGMGPTARSTMGERARRHVEREYTLAKVAERHRVLYESLARRPASADPAAPPAAPSPIT